MKFLKVITACAVIAATIGSALAVASTATALYAGRFGPLAASPFSTRTAYASTGGLLAKEIAVLTDQGITPARAWQAIDVQGKVAQRDLVRKVEARTGSAFAGVWFEPATAQLHIGTTSATSRRAAEKVAESTGLSAEVTTTPVRSTMAALLATQKKWNRKLSALFAQNQLKTGLDPAHNAVSVTLSSSVALPQRTALKHEASAASVNVFVTVAASPDIRVAPLAKECNNFGPANCNPSITPGVTIMSPRKCIKVANTVGKKFYKTEKECLEGINGKEGEWEEQGGICTAGPEAIPIANKKERVLLTAGHCVEGGGGENQEWQALNREAKEWTLIGKARKFRFGGKAATLQGDFGEVPIEAGGAWQTGKPAIPVLAVTAEWKQKEETRYPVKGERIAVVNNTNCHEGQTSGETCGEIKLLNVTVPYEANHIVEGLVEDTGATLNGEGGDSGGPWLFVETNKEVLMEGLHSGLVPECVNGEELVGAQFFKSQSECFEGVGGGKGKWQLTKYECKEVAKAGEGVQFYETLANCQNFEKAGKGKFERKPQIHLVYQPLTAPVKGGGEGPLAAFNLELLTTANENRTKEIEEEEKPLLLPEPTAASPITATGKSGKVVLETKGGTKVECGKGEDTFSATKFKSGTFDVLFSECKSALVKCMGSEDKTAGSILLKGEFRLWYGFLSKEEVLHTSLVLLPKETKITCGELAKVTLKGCVASLLKPLKEKTKVLVAEFAQTKSVNDITKVLNEKSEKVGCSLEASVNGGAFEPTGAQLTEELAGIKQGGKEASVEVMS